MPVTDPSKRRREIEPIFTGVGEVSAPVLSKLRNGNFWAVDPPGVNAKSDELHFALVRVLADEKEISVLRLIPVGKTFQGVSWIFGFVALAGSSSKIA